MADSLSGTDQDDSLYAAEVTFVFADDAVTQAGKGDTIDVMGEERYVMIAGEELPQIHATLVNDTGYAVASVTSSNPDLTVDEPSDRGRTWN